MKKLLSDGAILVGHGLYNDLKGMLNFLTVILSFSMQQPNHFLKCLMVFVSLFLKFVDTVLKLDHARVIDTAYIFKYSEGLRRPSLNNSCKASCIAISMHYIFYCIVFHILFMFLFVLKYWPKA